MKAKLYHWLFWAGMDFVWYLGDNSLLGFHVQPIGFGLNEEELEELELRYPRAFNAEINYLWWRDRLVDERP